ACSEAKSVNRLTSSRLPSTARPSAPRSVVKSCRIRSLLSQEARATWSSGRSPDSRKRFAARRAAVRPSGDDVLSSKNRMSRRERRDEDREATHHERLLQAPIMLPPVLWRTDDPRILALFLTPQ